MSDEDDTLEFVGPGGDSSIPISKFDFKKLNKCGYVWEGRIPGVDCEESWEGGECEYDSLTEAVNDILPNYAAFGLTLENAAKLLLMLGVLIGTGMEIEAE